MNPDDTRRVEHPLSEQGLDFASVSDESSPDTRATGRHKVPIFAQVVTDEPLGWYYDVRSAFPHIVGELKGMVVAAQFASLPADLQRRVWDGMKNVRIHITDPRPYVRERDELYREAVGVVFPIDELTARARAGDPVAIRLMRASDELVGQLILSDSRPARLARILVDADEMYGYIDRAHDYAKPLGLDLKGELKAVRSANKSLVERASALACKSGPAFNDAIEAVTAATPNDDDFRFNLAARIAGRVLPRLRDHHAYDRGDEKLLARVQGMRDRIGQAVLDIADPFAHLEPFNLDAAACPPAFTAPLTSIESSSVTQAQAADVAARMAAVIYEREGLPGAVKRFDYVVFNGGRVTENNAEEHLRRWHAISN